MGDHGQIMFVAPTTGTVVVRTGDDDSGSIQPAIGLKDVARRV
jgi:hypothetical protein